MTWYGWAALAAGCGLGVGLALLLGRAAATGAGARPGPGPLRPGGDRGYRHPATRRLARLFDHLVPERELTVLGRSRRHYLTGMAVSAAIGLAIAPTLVSCWVSFADLAVLPGVPGGKTMTATFTSTLDMYRTRGLGFGTADVGTAADLSIGGV